MANAMALDVHAAQAPDPAGTSAAPHTIVMGLDQHRAQITAEWLDTETGEASRARLAPADRAAVRRFLGRFRRERLEVARASRSRSHSR